MADDLFTPTVANALAFKVNTVDNTSIVSAGPVQFVDQFLSNGIRR